MMGTHVQNGALREFGNRVLSQQNKVALDLNREQIMRSIRDLEETAHLICDIEVNPIQLNMSKQSRNLTDFGQHRNHESWLNSLNQNLQKFSDSLPTHKRLSVATGIAAYIRKHDNQLGSLVKPLIQSISTLFHHLQHETETQMSLLQLISFSTIFSRISEIAIESNKLLVFGQTLSKSSLSELISKNKTSQLIALVQDSFLNQSSTFAQERVLQRLINHADFLVTESKSKSEECKNFPVSCLCTYRSIKINFPSLPKQGHCIEKQNDYKFKWENETFLTDGSKAIIITRKDKEHGKWGGFVKLPRFPIFKLKKNTRGFMVSTTAVMFPDGLKNVSIKCFSNMGEKSNLSLSVPEHSILRLKPGCTYISDQIEAKFPIMRMNAKYDIIGMDEMKNFSIIHFDHKVDISILNMMEEKFSEALLNEDNLHTQINQIASQTWLQLFLSKWMEYLLPYFVPAGAAVVIILLCVCCALFFYLKCCCCSCCDEKGNLSSVVCVKYKKSEDLDLESRVAKLETFFEFFIHDKYHQIPEKDVRQKIEMNKTE